MSERACERWKVGSVWGARAALALAIGLGAAGCGPSAPPEPPPKYEVLVRVMSEPGRPIEGATISPSGDRRGGQTGPDGSATLTFSGGEGESFEMTVKCPDGFESPAKPLGVTLRHVEDGQKKTEYDVSCAPMTHNLIVAIRADNGPNLPVMKLGEEIARTDASGAATVLLTVRPDDKVDLKLGTSEPGNESLQPGNPTQSFVVHANDDVVAWRQTFVKRAARRVTFVRAVPKSTGPVRIGGVRR